MPKAAKRKRRRGSRPKRLSLRQSKASPFRRLIARLKSPVGAAVAFVGLMLTLVGTYYLVRAQISVEPDAPLDPKQPLLTPFRITNNSILSIYQVSRRIGVDSLTNAEGGDMSDFTYDDDAPVIPELGPREATTVSIQLGGLVYPIPFTKGDVTVEVLFTTVIGRKKREFFRFATKQAADGTIHWYHKALSEIGPEDIKRMERNKQIRKKAEESEPK